MSGFRRARAGYTMVALVVLMAIMAIGLLAAEQSWKTLMKREREEELIFRGEQIAMAIQEFKTKTGAFPTDLKQLVENKPRFLRQVYSDPMHVSQEGEDAEDAEENDGYWYLVRQGDPLIMEVQNAGKAEEEDTGPVNKIFEDSTIGKTPGTGPGLGGTPTGPIIGVASRSDAESFRSYNERTIYRQWLFISEDVCGKRAYEAVSFMMGIGLNGAVNLPCQPKGLPGQPLLPGMQPPGMPPQGGAPQPPGGAPRTGSSGFTKAQ